MLIEFISVSKCVNVTIGDRRTFTTAKCFVFMSKLKYESKQFVDNTRVEELPSQNAVKCRNAKQNHRTISKTKKGFLPVIHKNYCFVHIYFLFSNVFTKLKPTPNNVTY